MYDDANEPTRPEALTVEPLLTGFVTRPARRRRRDSTENRLAGGRELGVTLDDVSPVLEGQHDPAAVGIDRLPHLAMVRAGIAPRNSLSETRP